MSEGKTLDEHAQTSLVLGTILAASLDLRADFTYAFSFAPLGSFAATTIQYSAPILPSPEDALSLGYLQGDVNGCAPSTIEAVFQDPTTIVFSSGFGDASACAGNTTGVVGFAFATGVVSGVGTYPTSTAGRAVQSGDGTVLRYVGGVLTVTETPAGEPVPEPPNAVAAGTAILLYAACRLYVGLDCRSCCVSEDLP